MWPVRQPRPVTDKLAANHPLLCGQRVLDALFPCVQGIFLLIIEFVKLCFFFRLYVSNMSRCRRNNCYPGCIRLWKDCNLPVALQVFQFRCNHICGMWRERKWNVWGIHSSHSNDTLLFLVGTSWFPWIGDGSGRRDYFHYEEVHYSHYYFCLLVCMISFDDGSSFKLSSFRTALVANTSNMPVAAREASIYTGITLAEYFRLVWYSHHLPCYIVVSWVLYLDWFLLFKWYGIERGDDGWFDLSMGWSTQRNIWKIGLVVYHI